MGFISYGWMRWFSLIKSINYVLVFILTVYKKFEHQTYCLNMWIFWWFIASRWYRTIHLEIIFEVVNREDSVSPPLCPTIHVSIRDLHPILAWDPFPNPAYVEAIVHRAYLYSLLILCMFSSSALNRGFNRVFLQAYVDCMKGNWRTWIQPSEISLMILWISTTS